MSEAFEYGEDDFEDEIPDEEDELRREIMEAEINEVWLEEPGDDEDEPQMPPNPFPGLFSAAGGLNIPGNPSAETEEEKPNEDPEH